MAQQLAEASADLRKTDAALTHEQVHAKDAQNSFQERFHEIELRADEAARELDAQQNQLVHLHTLLELQLEQHQADVAQIQTDCSREVEQQQQQLQQQSIDHQDAINQLQPAQRAEFDSAIKRYQEEYSRMQQLSAAAELSLQDRLDQLQSQILQADMLSEAAASQVHSQAQAISRLQQALSAAQSAALQHAAGAASQAQQHKQQAQALVDELAQCKDRHSSGHTQLQQEHAQAMASALNQLELNAAGMQSSLQQHHASALADLRQEHRQALADALQQHEEASSRKQCALQQEHVAAIDALRQEHAQDLADALQMVETESERLQLMHAATIVGLKQEHAEGLAAAAEQLESSCSAMQQQHSETLANALHEAAEASADCQSQLKHEHAAAFTELRQELDAELDALRNEGIQHERAVRAQLQAGHAAQLAAQQERHAEELADVNPVAASATHPGSLQDAYAGLWARQTVGIAMLRACLQEACAITICILLLVSFWACSLPFWMRRMSCQSKREDVAQISCQ